MLTDGPHGLRKQVENADHLGLNKSVPATCFPPAAALAASWNEELIYEMGEALGIECRAENVDVLLGPGANIKRSPLCGRNLNTFRRSVSVFSTCKGTYHRAAEQGSRRFDQAFCGEQSGDEAPDDQCKGG